MCHAIYEAPSIEKHTTCARDVGSDWITVCSYHPSDDAIACLKSCKESAEETSAIARAKKFPFTLHA